MDGINLIRAFIFLVAGLVVLLFPEKLMKMQDWFLTKINVKYRDSKRNYIILGIVFLVISAGLFIYSILN